MEPTVFIPTNFTDAGKLFGMFEIRNVVECFILCVPIALLAILLSPFGLTGTIVLVMQILRCGRGQGLLCAGKNRIAVEIRSSQTQYDLITTNRADLEKREIK